jgi:hypothetical protein
MNYFYSVNSQKFGPYKLKDLQTVGPFSEETLVWKEGYDNWINISDVPELENLIALTPPLLPNEITTKKATQRIGNAKTEAFFYFKVFLPIVFTICFHLYGGFQSNYELVNTNKQANQNYPSLALHIGSDIDETAKELRIITFFSSLIWGLIISGVIGGIVYYQLKNHPTKEKPREYKKLY